MRHTNLIAMPLFAFALFSQDSLISPPAFAADPVTFSGLGNFQTEDCESVPTAVSANGKVVVGYGTIAGEDVAFRWTADSGLARLSEKPEFNIGIESRALAVSGDGSVIVGFLERRRDKQAFRWDTRNGLELMPLFGEELPAEAVDVSHDGNVIAGHLYPNEKAFTWTAKKGYLLLDSEITMSGRSINVRSRVNTISQDGQIAGGSLSARSVNLCAAFLWQNGGSVQLKRKEFNEGVPSYMVTMLATDTRVKDLVNQTDGSISILGEYENKNRGHSRGFLIHNEVLHWLEDKKGNWFPWPDAVSGDGTRVVGKAYGSRFEAHGACLWQLEKGLVPVAKLLRDNGVDLGAWKLTSADSISHDGTVIVGNGVNPLGRNECWIAAFPK